MRTTDTSGSPSSIASVLCVLSGTYLCASDLEDQWWGRVTLACVMLLYHGLLIGGTKLLVGARATRPAALLSLLAGLFFVDPTLRVEGLVTRDGAGLALAMGWLLSSVGGVLALREVLDLRVHWTFQAAAVLSMTSIATAPAWMAGRPGERAHVLAVMFWVTAGLAWLACERWRDAECALARDGVARATLARVLSGMSWLAVVGVGTHALISLYAYDERVAWIHVLPLLALVPLRARTEPATAASSALLLLCGATEASNLSITATVVGLALAYRARSFPRLMVAAALTVFVAHWSLGARSYPLPEPALSARLVTCLVLLAITWRKRSMLAALAVPCMWIGARRGVTWEPSALELGAVLLALAFLSLVFGIARDLKRARVPAEAARSSGP